jgi:hypothetical protein
VHWQHAPMLAACVCTGLTPAARTSNLVGSQVTIDECAVTARQLHVDSHLVNMTLWMLPAVPRSQNAVSPPTLQQL